MAEAGVDVLMGELESLTKDPKATDDVSAAADAAIAEAESLVKGGRNADAIEALLAVEKKARQACDGISTSRLAKKILEICKLGGDWPGVTTHLAILAKKHGQLKRVTIDMVELSMSWIDETPSYEAKLAYINGISEVTHGKIFVEVQGARLMKILSGLKEAEGKLDEASAILEEVQVETFGGMERREKTEYILEQMRLVLARKDTIRCQIISKKINPKLLEAEDFQDLKLKFNNLMIRYHHAEDEFLQIARCYRAIYSTASVIKDEAQWRPALEAQALYLLLAPYSNEQSDLLNKLNILEEKKLAMLPTIKKLVNDFLTLRLMKWPLPYSDAVKASPVFSSEDGGEDRWAMLRRRVIHHNLKTVSTYYSQIRMARLAELLEVEVAEVEQHLSDLVTSGFIYGRMDRPAGIATFQAKKEPTEVLNEWSADITKVLDLIEESCHFVEKERMVQAAKAKKLQALQKA